MAEKREIDNSPSAEASDSLQPEEHDKPEQLSPVGVLVHDLLVKMNAAGDDAEKEYQQALEELRKHPMDAVIELARQEGACCNTDYATRWAVVYAAAKLEHPAALELLRSIVLTPIQAEQNEDPHASTVAEETIIRTTAVDGVATLARDGNDDAIETLLSFLELPSFSIRRAAVHGLLTSPKGDDLRDRIAKCLPKDQRFILDLKKVDVRKVPQVEDPRRHLSETARADCKPAPPDAQDRRKIEQEDSRVTKKQQSSETYESDTSPQAGVDRDKNEENREN